MGEASEAWRLRRLAQLGGGGAPRTGRRICTHLIPPPPNPRETPPLRCTQPRTCREVRARAGGRGGSRANPGPKDARRGGSAVVPTQVQSTSACIGSPVKPLARTAGRQPAKGRKPPGKAAGHGFATG